jgi:hypothetical protein
MREHVVPDRPPIYAVPESGDDSHRLDAKCHRRSASHVPVARADDVIPTPETGGLDLDQQLVFTEGARLRDLERLDGATRLFEPGYPHRRTPIVNVAPPTAPSASGPSPSSLGKRPAIGARRRKGTVGM